MTLQQTLTTLQKRLTATRLCDRFLLKRRLQGIAKITKPEKQQAVIQSVEMAITRSIELKASLQQQCPEVNYPEPLPVSQAVDDLKTVIADNQVVIIAGETGSGKTTQIPKICLELGRGIEGFIGHTQPRRIAARTVASRIAEELDVSLGQEVGYKVRFSDQVSDNTYIKLMTDGILLAEMQRDKLLRQYDTLIIDEAHERSLNIDFILGYIKRILPKRPDLKVIITSATIDPERFSKHFNNAPIVEVSGRTYPVDIHYRPLDEVDGDYVEGIIAAVDELSALPLGDILVFLNGEREIRDVMSALEKQNYRDTQVLPLFSRLSVAEQNRIFAPHRGRNIVLATNVAETSLTVPGIRYVIDPGTARISRYSYRTKVQRLPIEPISQASANQRSGRCGRVAAGVCIRLYSEQDFLGRPEFTDPEILRTNLATVILQMLALGLGKIEEFEFVQAPDQRNINDGMRLLEELAAINTDDIQRVSLTNTGRQLALFAVDPRLAKMMLSGIENGCAKQVAIIVAGLSIQDPRERPMDKQQAADQQHTRFKDKTSDFVSLLNLYQYVEQQQKQLSNNQFRTLCKREFLSYVRIREWQDIIAQLKQTCKEQNWLFSSLDMELANSSERIHQALLSGLLSHIGNLDENREYKGARNSRFYIFPGSGLAKKTPKWLMAAELVETSRLFARMCAKIEPHWLEPIAQHLFKYQYSEPHWDKKQGQAMAYEQVSLYGLVVVPKRKVAFAKIDPQTSRELMILEGLVHGDIQLKAEFFKHNQDLVRKIQVLEDKARRRDFLVDEQVLCDFYQQHIADHVVNQAGLLKWYNREVKNNRQLLKFDQQLLLNNEQQLKANDYPTTWQQDKLTLPLSYHFEPGSDDDGVSVTIAISMLNQVEDRGFEWLIPAMRLELITALIRSLPKQLRKNFVPAPNYAQACFDAINIEQGPLDESLRRHLLRMSGVRLPDDCFDFRALEPHLRMNFKICDNKGKLVTQGRCLTTLQEQLQGKVKQSIAAVAEQGIERDHISEWDFNVLPRSYEKKVSNIRIQAFPALVDKGADVAIELFEDQQRAEQAMLRGATRLILLNIPSPVKYLEKNLPNKAKLGLYFNPFGKVSDLLDDCILACATDLLSRNELVPYRQQDYDKARDFVRAEIADHVLQTAIKLERVLLLRHDIAKQLKGSVALTMIQAHADIKTQLNNMVYKGFVSNSGVNRLDDILRYLQAIVRRLEKLPVDPNADRLKMLDVAKAQALYDDLLAKQPKNKLVDDAILDIRWMIEEFRVSVFAQNIGTSMPVSLKRIKLKIAEFA
ncbi:ATP-dependent RNA helicase HrpA [Thalassotalea ponticola]|uniref:ATP-dependent RNA helicase HrpA n=1 Tax=Thalassotalea ponticola TaxID=1523392 RepID=UPI0025B3184F|nr:ATP-dependent RNA helicase HrpA [Thalassotalea ponticola]MDN3653107.1 ATP-dependent RNA helicase HrpA [Thalassotalea ponticola]